jgi:hypothetical protein
MGKTVPFIVLAVPTPSSGCRILEDGQNAAGPFASVQLPRGKTWTPQTTAAGGRSGNGPTKSCDQYRLVQADSENPHSSGAEGEGGNASLDQVVAEMSKRGVDPADLGMDPLGTEP